MASIGSERRRRVDRSPNDYDWQVPHSVLFQAAQRGDVAFLYAVRDRFGRVQYDPCIALAALAQRQLAFWKQLARMSVAAAPPADRRDVRLKVLADLFDGYSGPDTGLVDLFADLFDDLLQDTDDADLDADLCAALALHPPRRPVVEYIVERRQFRFKAAHLKLAQLTFSRGLVGYVRARLHADVVDDEPDPVPSDCDLACILMEKVKGQYTGPSDLQAVLQVLLDYPNLIDRMLFFMIFLEEQIAEQRRDALSDPIAAANETVAGSSSDDGSCSDPDSDTPTTFYRPELAQLLFSGVLDPDEPGVYPHDGSGTGGILDPDPSLVGWLEAVKPTGPATADPQSFWINKQLTQTRTNAFLFIGDVLYVCRLVLADLGQVSPALQRWDLVPDDDDVGRRDRRRPFRADCVPMLAELIARCHESVRNRRASLIRQKTFSEDTEPAPAPEKP